MDLPTAVKTCIAQKYVDFNGRAPRSEYWWFQLAYFIAYAVFLVVDTVLGLYGILAILLALAALLPMLGVSVRRLHDLGKSGWWLFIALVPLVGGLLLLYWYVQKGTTGDNLYGPDPLA